MAGVLRLIGATEHNLLAGAAGVVVASLIWLPVTRRWSARAHLARASTVFLFVVYLIYAIEWTFHSNLGPFSTVGGVVLWLLEVFAAVLSCAYLWELCDALGTEHWRRRITARTRLSMPYSDLPMVSLHVPAHNEPPDMVIQTLRSLLRLDYPRYEVILIDDNTDDENLWGVPAHPEDQRAHQVVGGLAGNWTESILAVFGFAGIAGALTKYNQLSGPLLAGLLLFPTLGMAAAPVNSWAARRATLPASLRERRRTEYRRDRRSFAAGVATGGAVAVVGVAIAAVALLFTGHQAVQPPNLVGPAQGSSAPASPSRSPSSTPSTTPSATTSPSSSPSVSPTPTSSPTPTPSSSPSVSPSPSPSASTSGP